jgi:hypothetical protein
VAATADIPKQLAWEARQRPRAGVAALLGTLALVVSLVLQIVIGRTPTSSFEVALQHAVAPGKLDDTRSLRVPIFQYLHDHAALGLATAVASAVGYFGLAWVAAFLGGATAARNPQLPRWAAVLPIVGGVVMAVSVVALEVISLQRYADFLSGPRTVAAATEIAKGEGVLVFPKVLGFLGSVALAAGLGLIALNAMRAGLLTRFYGVLGIITAVMLVLLPLPLVQIFWLGAMGILCLGFWPGGAPPAWASGKAEPWPPSRPAAPAPPARGRPEPETAPASARRKRKKRS